jgi:hypothetical protein
VYISSWFRRSRRCLIDDRTDLLSRGKREYIEYMYLVDMDNNEFCALSANNPVQPILVWTMEELWNETDWVTCAEEEHATCKVNAFPLPRSIEGSMKEAITAKGMEITDCLSWSIRANVYLATIIQTNRMLS